MNILTVFARRGNEARTQVRTSRARYRPSIDDLECRLVLSHAGLFAPLGAPMTAHVAPHAQAHTSIPIKITGINLTGVQQAANNVLSAVGTVTGTLAGHAFTAPVTITPQASTTATGATQVLDLQIGAIHLNLLGLKVDTSPICLDITAQPGPGNLLGNLLSGVSNLLNGTTPTTSVLGDVTNLLNQTVAKPTGTGTTSVLGLVNSALHKGLASLGSPSSISQATTTQILNLSVAPVNLNLLGLNVHLDNCNNGPVTVDISAVPGNGNLLGNLLGDVAHLLDSPGHPVNALAHDLSRVLGILDAAKPA